MIDVQILAASIASRQAFERVAAYITADEMTPAVGFWYNLVREWYARDRTANSVDLSAIRVLGESRISSPKQRETILGVLSDMPSSSSPDNVAQIALELKRRNTGMELATAIAAQDSKKIQKLYAKYGDLLMQTSLVPKRAEWQLAVTVEDLFSKVGKANRIPLAPAKLNERIGGGALPGHHIGVFARPEMGKSTFAVNMAVVMAVNGSRVLYVGNEDQIDVLKSRAVSRATSMSWREAEKNPERAIKLYKQRGLEDTLRFAQLVDGSPEALRSQIEEFQPTVMVVDQIRNLDGGGDGLTQKLEENGKIIRKMLLEYALIGISITQASVSAEGKLWLGMEDVDSSKTGLPATVDLLLGIGATQAMLDRGQRGISLPKNKLSSEPNSHEGIIVEIDKSLSKYK